MLWTQLLVWPLVLVSSQVTGLVITRDPEQNALISTPATATLKESFTSSIKDLSLPTVAAVSSVEAPLSVVTLAPESSGAALQRRQPCCFNEQGFRVDCNQWTGYYCECQLASS